MKSLHWMALMALLGLAMSAVAKPKLTIATSQYPPFEYLENRQVVGEDTVLIRRAVEMMGYEADIAMMPWARAEIEVGSGDRAMIYSLTYSEQRNERYYFSEPINQVRDVFFRRKGDSVDWEDLDDLAGKVIGISSAYSYAPEFMAWMQEGRAYFSPVSHDEPELTNLRMLAFGRIDLFICEISVCRYIIHQHQDEFPELRELEAIPRTVGAVRAFRAGFSRQLPQGRRLRDDFNRALKQLRH
ncbi:transporter substrate-binding domain-containing protein [Marinobacteraceae bacterium S3BR75-40.1]